MDWLTFCVEMSKVYAVPVAALVVAGMYRKPLIILIERIRTLRHKDTSVDIAPLASALAEMVHFEEPQPTNATPALPSGTNPSPTPRDNASSKNQSNRINLELERIGLVSEIEEAITKVLTPIEKEIVTATTLKDMGFKEVATDLGMHISDVININNHALDKISNYINGNPDSRTEQNASRSKRNTRIHFGKGG